MITEPLLIEDALPEEEPVTVAEARAQCEDPAAEDSDVDPADDAMYAIRIAAAREHCENFLGLTLAPKVYSVEAAAFPGGAGGYRESFTYTGVWPWVVVKGGPNSAWCYGGIPLPLGPVRWARIEYGDESDMLSLEQDVGFRIDRTTVPNRLLPIGTWPTVDTSTPDSVRITYGAGYGVNSDASIPTPAAVKMAILGMVGYLHENRGNTQEAALLELPKFVEAMLRPLRIRLGMA